MKTKKQEITADELLNKNEESIRAQAKKVLLELQAAIDSVREKVGV